MEHFYVFWILQNRPQACIHTVVSQLETIDDVVLFTGRYLHEWKECRPLLNTVILKVNRQDIMFL